MKRVAINGFGRIGRQTFKAALDKKATFEIVAINDLTTPENLAYLLKYDSIYGTYDRSIDFTSDSLIVDGKKYPVLAEKDPTQLPWKAMKVDVVIESTGFFTKSEGARHHLTAGAKRVVISAPADSDDIKTYLIGVNADEMDGEEIVSNASCTTNCIAPAIAVLDEYFGVEKSLMSTIHAYTATQKLVDGPDPKDFRRGRAAAENVSPSSTGAAKATTRALPHLKGKFDGISIRVPVACGSLSDIVAVVKRKTSVEEVNQAFTKASKAARWKGVLAVTTDAIVSADIIGNPASSIIDLPFTRVIDGDLVKVLAWYDNEWAYSCRLVELAERM